MVSTSLRCLCILVLLVGCYDKDKERDIQADVDAAKKIAEAKIPPFRSALHEALQNEPITTDAPCPLLPDGMDWNAQATGCVERLDCAGVTFISFEYRSTKLPLETVVAPSRVRFVVHEQTPDGLAATMKGNPMRPEYETIQRGVKFVATPAFWTYEIVVVDDGNEDLQAVAHPAASSSASARRSKKVIAPSPSAEASASEAPEPVVHRVTRVGRAFGYDYASAKIRCFGRVRAELPRDDERSRTIGLMVAGVAALRSSKE